VGAEATDPSAFERDHRRAEGSSDATVDAVGKVSEGFEWIERARGHLYEFHHLMGHADGLFDEAATALDAAGHPREAEAFRGRVVGRDILEGQWSFQVVEEYDRRYYEVVRDAHLAVRDALSEGRPHVFEAEMKAARRADPRNAI